jgi:hypothetical protein
VDDLKISHMERSVVDIMISIIEARYGKMVVTHENAHTYVGMDIKFTNDGEVKILTKQYIEESLEAFPEDCSKKEKPPAAAHLFEVNPECPKLSEKDRRTLDSITAKMLFVTKRERPDIQVPIAFLASRVTVADHQDDWKKLKRMLEYLHSTLSMPFTLSIDDTREVKTCVDAAYTLHDDMKSHTGGVIMMGKGVLYAKSSKHKLNIKSSTEAELVGASDFLPQTIWTQNFLEGQGYPIVNNEFFQDNMSAMKMEKKGSSAGQRSRHINIRYYFIKDRIESGDINLIHCPTGIMIADFFTKPLQGALLTKFRDLIMGITHFSSLIAPTLTVPRCVLDFDNPSNKTTASASASTKNNTRQKEKPVTTTRASSPITPSKSNRQTRKKP